MGTKEKIRERIKGIRTEDIMTRDVVSVISDTPVKDLAHLFLEKRISGVPVVDEERNVVGVITVTDLFSLLRNVCVGKAIDLSKVTEEEKDIAVKEVMSKDVITIEEETPFETVIKIMSNQLIHTLPVTQEGKLIGVIGRRDVINASFP